MDVRMALAGVLIAGYVAYKGVERAGGKLPFSMGARRGRTLPARKPPSPVAFERVTLDATPATLQSFIRLTGHLERLGFRIVADYAIAGWPDLYCRGLVHQDKPVHAVIVERTGLPAHVELFTLFDDLSALVTSGSEEADDPGKPASLRYQQIPGLSVDELYVQHLSSMDSLFQDQLNPMPATRLGFFEHQRALLVIEHELRKAKRALRTDSLTRALDALPELPTRELLKRYGLEEPEVEAPEPEVPTTATRTIPVQPAAASKPEAEEAPKRWGIGSSLLSKRMAARDEIETPVEDAAPESEPVQTLVLEPEAIVETVVLAVSVEQAPPTFEIPLDGPEPEASYELTHDEGEQPEPEASSPLPFEVVPEPPAPARLPWETESQPSVMDLSEPEAAPEPEAAEPSEPLPFEIVTSVEPEPAVLALFEESEAAAPEPTIRLPFEVLPDEPVAPVATVAQASISLPFESSHEDRPSAGAKPTCPHCGATLFSSLSSRCSKCKQAVR